MTVAVSAPRTLRQLADIPVTRLHGVSPRRLAALAELGIENVLDLLTTYPRRYIDRTRRVDVADLAVGDQAVVLATVRRTKARRTRHGRSLVELSVHDGTAGMTVAFFNQPWRARQLSEGTEALFFGKLDIYRGIRRMTNPVVDVVVGAEEDGRDAEDASTTTARTATAGTATARTATAGAATADAATTGAATTGAARRRRTLRIVPVYPASAKVGLTSWEIGAWVDQAVRRAGELADPLDRRFLGPLGLIDRTRAFHDIHLPAGWGDQEPARRRLAFDELLRLQLSLVLRRRALEGGARAIRHSVSPLEVLDGKTVGETKPPRGPVTLVRRYLDGLPFDLTAAQRRALAAIFAEMGGPLPMHRLLQGDVGSGKTVVAVATLLAAVQGGHQGALMAPTAVLAEQHSAGVSALLAGLSLPDPGRLGGERPVSSALLTSRTTAAERARLHEGLRAGSVDLVVGTHALLTDDVQFSSLGAVVIDEQHRFGVEQRAALREKGRSSVRAVADGPRTGADPDLLVMTATPIPRTAALVRFGDLDMVILDELPPGRSPVKTVWARTAKAEQEAWDRVCREARAGNRAYVVCPLVEGSERVQARAATEELGRLARDELAGIRLALLHGQMPAGEKDGVMAAFRSGDVQVLVATTVVEVGVDVPEATVMVVEDAGRFGVAQLHQLRGRVGRSSRQSWCYLLGDASTTEAAKRLRAVERISDGFALAEMDLELRGEGTVLGERQQGLSDLKVARLRDDTDLLDGARRVAEAVTEGDPLLDVHPDLADEVRLLLDPAEEAFLFKS